jgi:hypothetical protein
MDKRKVPLAILEILQHQPNSKLHLVKVVSNDNAIVHLADKIKGSSFYFTIVKSEHKNNNLHYNIECMPKGKDVLMPSGAWLLITDIPKALNDWLDLIEHYENINTIFDDPILRTNQERLINKINLTDEDASFTSFDLDQQLYLDSYLESTYEDLEAIKTGRSDEEVLMIEELKKESIDIKQSLTKETKKEIVKKLAHFWGKIQILGLEVFKEIAVKAVKEITVKLITGS